MVQLLQAACLVQNMLYKFCAAVCSSEVLQMVKQRKFLMPALVMKHVMLNISCNVCQQ
ncbi:hypothetical protein GA0116948_10436 [Chitinophaga costaii]|uniref:Uncharacterized protein n=1 Tax=Chitinophaga costaii TaxID=1335309 RepID=A0A1C4CAU0_9BACT|nr:hypothetical protein GA0116948_10436 [Chitinophaga costaii]